MDARRKVFILLILCIVWAVVIFVGCTLPPRAIPKFSIPHIDKAAHFGFFFVQSVLLSLLFHFKTRRSYFQIILFSTLQAFLYGGLIEILQNEFFSRSGDWFDLLADVLGGLSGALAYFTIFKFFKKISRS